jgi:hypothetical protein
MPLRPEDRPKSKHQPPKKAEKLANFIKAAKQHISSGRKRVEQSIIDRRMSICRGCEFFEARDDGGTCNKCGCGLSSKQKVISKLAWASSECPIGKWGKDGQFPAD